jgi:hypothetical protein
MVTFTGPGLEENCIGVMAYLRPTGQKDEVKGMGEQRKETHGDAGMG